MPWLGLTLELDPAAAEGFGEALLQAGAQSVSLENLDAPRPTLSALLLHDSDAREIVAAAAAAAGLPAVPEFSINEIADEDWVRKTQAQFAPVEIGARLWVGPTWHRPPAGRAALQLDPGLAFGTGTHPTTKLVLGFLEKTIQGGESVLDYGCGSGILAIAAAKLGAARVDAVDLDGDALSATGGNARANGVAVGVFAPERLPPGDYDVVVANILAQPLIVLEPLLAARTRAGGRIALAGILEAQAAEVTAAYGGIFAARVAAREEGWALIEGVRR